MGGKKLKRNDHLNWVGEGDADTNDWNTIENEAPAKSPTKYVSNSCELRCKREQLN